MRRRTALATITTLALAAGVAGIVIHLRRDVVPPDCRDARTLAQVAPRIPPGERLARIHMLAGGPLAFRFVCEADLDGPRALVAHYTSQLTEGGARHEVTVSISPVLTWQRVQ